MGQQQLLLLVLATVIVGIAIAVGILAFRENSINSNFDALTQDAIRIASDVQAWKQKPAMFGGSADGTKPQEANFDGASFLALGYSSFQDNAGQCYTNLNGLYSIVPSTSGTLVHAGNKPNDNYVQITVSGLSDADVVMTDGAWVRGGIGADGSPVELSSQVPGCNLTGITEPS